MEFIRESIWDSGFSGVTLMYSGGVLTHTFVLESTEHQRRERQDESRLRSIAKPAWQQGGGEHCAAAAAGGKWRGSPETPGGVSVGPEPEPSPPQAPELMEPDSFSPFNSPQPSRSS